MMTLRMSASPPLNSTQGRRYNIKHGITFKHVHLLHWTTNSCVEEMWSSERFKLCIRDAQSVDLTSQLVPQPNYEQLEKEVDRRKMSLAEAKLKAKGLNPDGTPALTSMGGFSPASKPSSPNVVKVEEKSPNSQAVKTVKKEPESRTQMTKSPHNGWEMLPWHIIAVNLIWGWTV